MLARRKAVRTVAAKPSGEQRLPLPDNPFAALASLKRIAS
jgi:hypothetical protein